MALVLAAFVALVVAAPALAQTVGTAADGTGSITINNPAKGETYTVYKLFETTLGDSGEVAYKGTVPRA